MALKSVTQGEPVVVQQSQNYTWCSNQGDAFSPDLVIGACTALIQSGRETVQNLSYAFHNRGIAYQWKKDYDRAIAEHNEGIRLDPKNVRAFKVRGLAYHEKGDNDRAIADYNEAIRLDPRDADAYVRRGIAYYSKKDYDRAIADDNEAIRLDPKNAKIGFISTFSGPQAVLGNLQRNSFELALDHLGRKMDGRPVEVIYEDDALKPDAGRQKTEKLIQSDKVDFLTGYIWSNVLLASLKPAVDSQTFIISAVAGPSAIAGELCSPFFFSTSWQNDQTPQAVGEYMNQKGVKSVFLIGPNYVAGKDTLAGVKRTFKGQVVGEEYTRWPDQLDFAAELSKARAAKPDSIFVFYPGAAGVQFLNQYAQAGLKGQIPLYQAFTIDETTLPLQKDLALGVPGAQPWVNDLPNEANKRFVSGYRAKYKESPAYHGALSYDAAMLINSAVVAVNGDLSKKDALRQAMEKANYASVRGPYRYGNNHFPIQNFYLQEAVKDAEGNYALKTVATILKDDQDRFHDKCPMK